MMPRRLVAPLFAAFLAAIGGCYVFDNPVDPEAASYRSPEESPPAAPKNLRLMAGGSNYAVIEWDPVERAEDYLIEYYRDSGPFLAVPYPYSPTTTTTLSHSSLTPGIHHYRVRARNQNGSSPWSAELIVSVSS